MKVKSELINLQSRLKYKTKNNIDKINFVKYTTLLILFAFFGYYTVLKKNKNDNSYSYKNKCGHYPNNYKNSSKYKCNNYIQFNLGIEHKAINNDYNYSSNTILYKNKLLEKFSMIKKINTTKINTLILKNNMRFGNSVIGLSKAIFSCEILLCKEILFSNPFLFINNPINYKKFNMTIKLIDTQKNCSDIDVICLSISFFYFYLYVNENKTFIMERTDVFRDEILNNIPNYNSHVNDLYIHIRSGDIFNDIIPNKNYPQPPLCFYDSIINNFSFRKIFLLSETDNNPVIDILLQKYSNTQFLHGNFTQDISYIVNACNLVISCSTFSLGLSRLSKKLKLLIQYDIIPKENNKYFLIDESKKYNRKNFINIIMKLDNDYYSKFSNTSLMKEVKQLMITEKCKTKFLIIHPK